MQGSHKPGLHGYLCGTGSQWSSILLRLILLVACSRVLGTELSDDGVRLSSFNQFEDGPHEVQYEPIFPGMDRSIIGRASDEAQTLSNNVPGKLNIAAGETQYWLFPRKAIRGPKSPAVSGLPSRISPSGTGQEHDPSTSTDDEDLGRRQDSTLVYVSFNTCDQPSAKGNATSPSPKQLVLYISKSSNSKKPSSTKNDYAVTVNRGFAAINFTASDDVYLAVSAPTDDTYSGAYNYELTASIDDFYAQKYNDTNLFFIDSDSHAALLYTNDTVPKSVTPSTPLFQAWLNINPPPFTLWAQNQNDSALRGLESSMCALQNHAQLRDPALFKTGMTLIGGGQPKQQFYLQRLNDSSSYQAFVGLKGNATAQGAGVVNGGGTLWAPTNFTTKDGINCALVYNLSFCSDVAYAVPTNPRLFPDATTLAAKYDGYAESSWANFSKSLQQIPCNTTASAQYSLAVDCGNCTRAYKRWLCTVSIPRCEDFSNPAPYLQPRAIGQPFLDPRYGTRFANDSLLSDANKARMAFNSSRNPLIDSDIQPGPYKEVLPCSDLCYGLVRGCPAALQFACPLAGHGLELSYGDNLPGYPLGTTCNNPDADLSRAGTFRPNRALWGLFGLLLIYFIGI